MECGHDICQECYGNILPNKNNEIRCPFCRNVNESIITEEQIKHFLDAKIVIFIFIVLAIFILFMILYLFHLEDL